MDKSVKLSTKPVSNHKGAREFPEQINAYLSKECQLGACLVQVHSSTTTGGLGKIFQPGQKPAAWSRDPLTNQVSNGEAQIQAN